MHDTLDKYLLQIEPKNRKSDTPINDSLTEKMENLLEKAEKGTCYRGFHVCACGKVSGCCDLIVDKYITNSLAAHYLRWHRSEVSESEIRKLEEIK